MRIEIRDATAFEGAASHYTGEDGYPLGHPVPAIVATDYNGREWWLPNNFRTEYDSEGFGPFPVTRYDLFKARDIAEAAHLRGWIDSDCWVELALEA